MTRDGWSPTDSEDFRDERRRPFFDLLALVRKVGLEQVLDVGCGTGELTAEAHRLLGARHTLGVDASAAMRSKFVPVPGVEVRPGSIPDTLPEGAFDLVLSNSALNWVPHHRAALEALASRMGPKGQLAIQMPSNPDTAFTRSAQRAAQAFASELSGYVYASPVQEPTFYSSLLETLGFQAQRVGTWHYPQRHASPAGLVAFARGGLLSPYRERLGPETFEAFARRYEDELVAELGPGPVFFPFRRLFVWGAKSL